MNREPALMRLKQASLLCFAGMLLYAPAVQAEPADLDPGFGNGGQVIFDGGPGTDRPWQINFTDDGGIIVNGHITTEADDDLLLLKFNSDGSPDTSFGTGGQVIFDTGGEEYGFGLAIQPDQKILTTVINETSSSTAFGQILRYNPDGTPDTSFGINGVATFDQDLVDHLKDIALQNDGKIVVAGNSGPVSWHDGLTARFNPDGTLDTSFGSGGFVIYDSGSRDSVESVAVQQDGKIIAAGFTSSATWDNRDIFMIRYNPDGTPDTGFGTGGMVIFNHEVEDTAVDMLLQDDGKIVLAGSAGPDFNSISGLLLRFNPDGTLDTTFGNNGVVMALNGPTSQFSSVSMQEDGRFVLSGLSESADNTRYYAEVYRFNQDGTPDSEFGNNGIYRHESCLEVWGIRGGVQPDGKYILSGVILPSDLEWNIMLLRLMGSAPDLTLSPPSGAYLTTQKFDVALILASQGISATGIHAVLDGNDVSVPLSNCTISGTLSNGGQTLRCPNISGEYLTPGTHDFTVTLDLSNGTSVSDSVTWKVKDNTEP